MPDSYAAGILEGYDSDDPDFVDVPARPEQAAAPRQAPSVPMIDPRIEVMRRLDMAQCYQSLMNESFFEEQTDATRQVDREVKGFIQERMLSLVGLGTTTSAPAASLSEFTSLEVMALKALAKSALAFKKPASSAQVLPVVDGAKKAPRKAKKALEPAKTQVPPAPVPATPVAVATPVLVSAPTRRKRKASTPPPIASPLLTPPPATSTPTPASSSPATTPPPPSTEPVRKHVIMVVGEDGVPREKEVVLSRVRQARPSGVTPAPTPSLREFEAMSLSQASVQAERNVALFGRNLAKADGSVSTIGLNS